MEQKEQKIKNIAERIKAKLQPHDDKMEQIDDYFSKMREFSKASEQTATEFRQHGEQLQILPSVIDDLLEGNNIRSIYFLLTTAATRNMLPEIHELLELNVLPNINQPLLFKEREIQENVISDHGNTLLGIAAYNGHLSLVKYLVEVRLADVNARDIHGNTPLHRVVYGDSYPFNHTVNAKQGEQTEHAEIANYLLQYGGDLSIKNNEQRTAYDCAKTNAPLRIENWVGNRFITNTGSASYYADKVRPVFEKRLQRLEEQKNNPNVFISVGMPSERKAKDYQIFCVEHAIKTYVAEGNVPNYYESFEAFTHILDNLTEEDWKYFELVINGQKPTSYSFKYGLIYEQLPKISKQSVAIGLGAMLTAYMVLENSGVSLLIGFGCGVAAWMLLTERAIKVEENQRAVKETRVNHLLQHDRFFKSSVYTLPANWHQTLQERGPAILKALSHSNPNLQTAEQTTTSVISQLPNMKNQ